MTVKSTLLDLVERSHHNTPYAYSGRGMFGKKCLAVDIDTTPVRFFADLLEVLVDGGDEGDQTESLIEAMRGAQTDSMGLDTVVYFPSVHYNGPCEECERELDDTGHCPKCDREDFDASA